MEYIIKGLSYIAKGFVSLFDFGLSSNSKKILEQNDAEALRSDWCSVFKDMDDSFLGK